MFANRALMRRCGSRQEVLDALGQLVGVRQQLAHLPELFACEKCGKSAGASVIRVNEPFSAYLSVGVADGTPWPSSRTGGIYPSVKVCRKRTIWSSSESVKPRLPTFWLTFWLISGGGQ